ncbi:hypothetical protein C8R45DRAFT_1095155 [Mycena sanguinolenta]|nr:hypothetical protein C8R45DRAFT_1095155 [Mycena sanguinolenta]
MSTSRVGPVKAHLFRCVHRALTGITSSTPHLLHTGTTASLTPRSRASALAVTRRRATLPLGTTSRRLVSSRNSASAPVCSFARARAHGRVVAHAVSPLADVAAAAALQTRPAIGVAPGWHAALLNYLDDFFSIAV